MRRLRKGGWKGGREAVRGEGACEREGEKIALFAAKMTILLLLLNDKPKYKKMRLVFCDEFS